MDGHEAKQLNENLEKINKNLKHLIRSVDDITSVMMTKEGEVPEPNYRV